MGSEDGNGGRVKGFGFGSGGAKMDFVLRGSISFRGAQGSIHRGVIRLLFLFSTSPKGQGNKRVKLSDYYSGLRTPKSLKVGYWGTKFLGPFRVSGLGFTSASRVCPGSSTR